MLVLVAHNGKTLELDVQPGTRVDAVQHALASLSGLPHADQIIICRGARLDPARTLATYGLPAEVTQGPAVESREPQLRPDVFLYSRSWLRADSTPPGPEPLPSIRVEEPVEPTAPSYPHPLDEPALNSTLRALPRHERLFKHHLATAQAVWTASHERVRLCKRLLSEQEVQSMAIDAARANVEVHYRYIHRAFNDFMEKYTALQQAQREVLLNFERDMDVLSRTELHAAVAAEGRRHLVDLVPKDRLQDWAASCRLSREQFAGKVAELEGLFLALQANVEGLLMKAPRTDLDEMGRQMEQVDGRLCQEAAIMQKLQNDFNEVQRKVEVAVKQLASTAPADMQPDAFCIGLDAIAARHVDQDLSKIRACDDDVEGFLRRCREAKNEMTCDVHEQLVQISGQQSRIRDMRNKLAVFQEVASKQGELFAELCLVGRIAAAYRACLAEVVRRRAFQELYAGQAAQLAERMAALREKEAARHEAFRAYVDPYIPADLQGQLGLLLAPPLCEVNIPASPGGCLPEVTMEEIQASPREARPSQLVTAVFKDWLPPGQPPNKKDDPPRQAQKLPEPTHEDLQLQNARLRADLAAYKAATLLRAVKLDPMSDWPTIVTKAEIPTALQAHATSNRASAGNPEALGGAASSPANPTTSSQQGVPASSSIHPLNKGANAAEEKQKALDEKREVAFVEATAAKDAVIKQLEAQLAAQAAQLQAFSDRIRALEALQGSSHLSSALQPGSGPMAYADEIVSGQGEAVSQMLEQEVSGGPEVGDGDVRLDCHPAELAEALVQQPVVEASNGKEVGQAEEQGEVVAGSGEGEGLQSGARELEVLASSSDGNKGQEQTQSSSIPEDPPSEHQQGDSQGDISARPRTEAVVQPADEPIESEGQQQSAELQAPATPELAVEPQNLPEAEYAVAQGTHRAPGEAALHVFGAPSGAEDAGGISGASATGDIADRIPLPPPAGHVHDSQPLTAPELSAPSQKDDAFCQEPGETETLEEGVDKDCISGTDPLPGDRELSCNPEPLHVVAAEEPGAAAGSGDQAHLAGTLERPQTCSQAEVVAEAAGAALEIAQDRAEPVEPEEEFHDPAESTHCQQEEC